MNTRQFFFYILFGDYSMMALHINKIYLAFLQCKNANLLHCMNSPHSIATRKCTKNDKCSRFERPYCKIYV